MRAPVVKYVCPQRWESLEGAGDRRFCDRCREHVHDLSAMEPTAARRFVADHPGACLRFEADDRGRVVFRSRGLAVVATAAALAGCAGWDEAAELASPADDVVEPDRRSAIVPDGVAIQSIDDAPREASSSAETTAPAPPSAAEQALEAREVADELVARRPGHDRTEPVSASDLRRYRRAQRWRRTTSYVVGR